MKSRTFTIFLLTENTTPEKALVNIDALEQVSDATEIPANAILYLRKNETHDPWWKGYLGLSRQLQQSYPGGILFIPVGNRWFAATFGQSYHHLSSSSYEYDFGLKTTLNAIDRKSLRSTDAVNPETAKRERIQAPKDSDLSFFSFDGDSNTVLKRISGRTQEQYQDLFTSVTGCDSIRVTTKKCATELIAFCQNLLGLYLKQDAEKKFPEVFNVRSEKNPKTLSMLDTALLNAIKQKDSSLTLSYPDMLNYQNLGQIQFGSLPAAELFTMESFWKSIPEQRLTTLTISQVKNSYNVCIHDADGKPLNSASPSLYKCLIFEHQHDGKLYHFCEGKWYCVNQSLVESLRSFLDPHFSSSSALPVNTYSSEADYNMAVSEKQERTLLFDRKDFFPKGQTQIELCDLCQLGVDDSVSLIHVKVGVHSSRLSHLFAQGYVGSQELLSDVEALKHFEKIVNASKVSPNDKETIIKSVKGRSFKVAFAIITKKPLESKSDALPLFSRINLRRAILSLNLMGIASTVLIIPDGYRGKESR